MKGERIDLSSDPGGGGNHSPGQRNTRRFLGVHFACCDVYSRVYINADETAYTGYCPRCRRRIRFHVGPGGTSSRFFRAE